MGVKQRCPLSPSLSFLCINEIGMIAEGVKGAVAGSNVRVTHMLYADIQVIDHLTLLVYAPNTLQTIHNRLASMHAPNTSP